MTSLQQVRRRVVHERIRVLNVGHGGVDGHAMAVVTMEHIMVIRKELDKLRSDLAAADAALIEARDTLCMGEDDDGYWNWFNRHEGAVFNRLAKVAGSN